MHTDDRAIKRYLERLIKEYRYPTKSIRTEVPFSKGKARYILDIVVYTKGQPHIVAEVKENIEDKRGIEQLRRYSGIGNQFAVLTDGFNDICFQVSRDNSKVQLSQIQDIPNYGRSLADIGKQKYSELVSIDVQMFKVVIHRLLDELRREIGSPLEALRVLSLLVLAKVHDEKTRRGLFRAPYDEPNENMKAKILRLLESITSQNPGLKSDLRVNAETIAMIVWEFQKFRLSELSERHNLSLLLENGFQKLYGEFYTPRAINQLIVGLLSPSKGKTVLDPACGLGGLIYEAGLRGSTVVGYEISYMAAQIAQTNLLLSNLPGKVHARDSLQKLEREDKFDYVVVVPPFSGTVRDHRLRHFKLGWSKKSQKYPDLFLELALNLANPSGRIAIVVPNGVLFSYSSRDTRLLIHRESTIRAIIELPDTAFAPYSRVKTSLLILEKREKQKLTEQGEVFISQIENLNEISETVGSFLRFEASGKLQESENTFAIRIETPEQLDVTYLKGLCSSKTLDTIETVKLGQIADITAGTSIKRVGLESEDGNMLYVKAGAVLDLSIDEENAEKIRVVENISRWKALPGDILMTRAGTVGRAALVPDDATEMIVGVNLVRIRIREQAPILPEYALAYLNSRQGKRQIAMFAGGSAIRSINMSELRKVRIPLISIEKQKEIAQELKEIVQAINEAETLLKESRNKLMKFSNDLENRLVESK